MKRIYLDRVPVNCLSESQTRQIILRALESGCGGGVVTVNVDHLVRCRRDPSYLELVKRAELAVADGMPLVWASRIQGTPLPERVAGSTISWALAEDLGKNGKRLFLLGGNPGVADKAAEVLRQRCPGLVIAGTHCPDLGFETDPDAIEAMRAALLGAQPDVIYVALGSPKQERLIDRLRGEMPELAGVWWLGVGISLSFMTGDVHRAPVWVQRLGLEWLHRMVQEPKRLYRRYLVDGMPYVTGLLIRCVFRRFAAKK